MGKASRKKQLQRQQNQYEGIKLSAALIELCEPFEPKNITTKEFEKLIALAAVAWNIAVLPKEKRLERLTAFIETMPNMKEELEAEIDTVLHDDSKVTDFAPATTMLHFVGAMIQRKDELFPNDDRIVINYNVKDNPEGPYLTVSSAHRTR
jgi:phage gp29-like protein